MRSRSDRFTYCVYNVANVNVDVYECMCVCGCARACICVYMLCVQRVDRVFFSRVSPYIILVMRVCRFNVQLINYTG